MSMMLSCFRKVTFLLVDPPLSMGISSSLTKPVGVRDLTVRASSDPSGLPGSASSGPVVKRTPPRSTGTSSTRTKPVGVRLFAFRASAEPSSSAAKRTLLRASASSTKCAPPSAPAPTYPVGVRVLTCRIWAAGSSLPTLNSTTLSCRSRKVTVLQCCVEPASPGLLPDLIKPVGALSFTDRISPAGSTLAPSAASWPTAKLAPPLTGTSSAAASLAASASSSSAAKQTPRPALASGTAAT
mmetsp:Transcript_6168/g.19208  ORF Transcript_6168/g.19208 Transcript_6168/m.19208 type:complete len:241 (-) Transcript_6168:1774-2496(-)